MATEILRPNAAGNETNITTQEPASTFHWDKVAETPADDGATTVRQDGVNTEGRDLYNLPAHSEGSGAINKITVYIRVHMTNSFLGEGSAYPSIRSDGVTTDGAENVCTGEIWENFSQEWAKNPAPEPDEDWTWDDIDALQIGVKLSIGFEYYLRCTQVYVEVDYTPVAPPGLENKSANMAAKMVAVGLI